MHVRIIGRGTYFVALQRSCNDDVTNWASPDLLVNWGLTGRRFRDRIASGSNGIAFAAETPVINAPINRTKYSQLVLARDAGVPCPETKTASPEFDRMEGDWLFKPMFSIGGRHICMAGEEDGSVAGYYQEFISGEDRRYELRVHACNWRDPSEYLCQKRIHNDPSQITWNHHTGGRFVTVNEPLLYDVFKKAQQLAYDALKGVGLDFGGVDFIVKHDGTIWFLEINMALGFTLQASANFWRDSMNMLTKENEDVSTN